MLLDVYTGISLWVLVLMDLSLLPWIFIYTQQDSIGMIEQDKHASDANVMDEEKTAHDKYAVMHVYMEKIHTCTGPRGEHYQKTQSLEERCRYRS